MRRHDVIKENTANGGTKRTRSDLTQFVLRGVLPQPELFVTMGICSKHFYRFQHSLKIVINIKICKRLIYENTVCSSISRVFTNDVTHVIDAIKYH